ncbi:hypothetical protein F66182_5303, partial [Fusarium sp. NRRL 66182]
MHFSALAISMLATSAVAMPQQGEWRGWRHWQQNQNQNQKQHEVVITHYVTHVVTAGGPAQTPDYPQVEKPQAVEAQPTTFSA